MCKFELREGWLSCALHSVAIPSQGLFLDGRSEHVISFQIQPKTPPRSGIHLNPKKKNT